MASNEKTSKRVARIAARILSSQTSAREEITAWDAKGENLIHFKWADIRALAASALTQVADKPKAKR